MFTMDQIDATHTAYRMGIEAGREVSITRIADLERQNATLRKALSHYAGDNYNGVDEIRMFAIPGFGEAGMDLDNSPGVGDFYVKLYDESWDTSGYDTIEDAIEELKELAERKTK
jgi:hypothetical protein